MNRPLRVLLVNPRDQGVRGTHAQHKCYPPLGLLYLAAALERAGHAVFILEANAFRLSDSEITRRALEWSPDLVGLPVLTPTEHDVLRILRDLRAQGLKCGVVLGGAGATTTPDRLMREMPQADYLLRGDAEDSLVALCALLRPRDPSSPTSKALSTLPNLSWRSEGSIVHNDPLPTTPPRDLLPARHLVQEAYDQGRYFALLERRRPVDSVLTSRGCPCQCRFCYNVQARYWTRPAEDVVDELMRLHDQGLRHVELVDDNFTLDRPRAMRIFDLLVREGARLRLVLKSRPERVDRELLLRARQAGVYQVSYGMESGVERILHAMGRNMGVEDIVRACTLTREAGLYCHTSWILGYPGETPETIRETGELILRIRPTTVILNHLRPYPETPVYLEARAEGTLVGDWSAESLEVPWVRLPWTREREDILREILALKSRLYRDPGVLVRLGGLMTRGLNLHMLRFALHELKSLF